jgi:uncharacterized protein YueI
VLRIFFTEKSYLSDFGIILRANKTVNTEKSFLSGLEYFSELINISSLKNPI